MAVEEIQIKFVADTTGIDNAVKAQDRLKASVDKTGKSYNDIEKEINDGINDALKEAGVSMKQLSDIITKTATGGVEKFKTLKQQLKEATNEAVQFGEKFGETSPQFVEAAKRAGELRAQIGDLNDTFKALDPDAKAEAFTQFGQSALGAFQVATGALQVFGVENEKVNKLAQQFQGAINLTQGINQLGQLGDAFKNIRVILGFTTTAQTALSASQATGATTTVALTAATEAEAVATTGAAAATRGFSAALTATGIGAFVVLIGALVAAMISLSNETDRAAESAERLKGIQDKQKQANEDLEKAKTEYQLITGAITDTEAAVKALFAAFSKDIAPLRVARENTLKDVQATKDAIASLQSRITQLQNSSSESAAFQVIDLLPQLEKQKQALATLQREISASDKLIADKEEALNITKAGLYKQDADKKKKIEEDKTKAAEDEARKQIAIQRQLLVEKQKLELLKVDEPIARIDTQIAQAQALAAFDIQNAKTTGQNILLIRAALETQLYELSKNRLAAEGKAEEDRLNQLKKQYEDALKEIKDLFDRETIIINLKQEGKIIDIDEELASLQRLKDAGTITEKQYLERRLANRATYYNEADKQAEENYNRERQFIIENVADEAKRTDQIEALDLKYNNGVKKRATQRKSELEGITTDIAGLSEKSENAWIDKFAAITNAAQNFFSALTDLQNEATQIEIDNLAASQKTQTEELQRQLDERFISKAQYEKRIQALNEETNQKTKRLQAEQAERNKRLAIFNAVTGAAQAIIQVYATVGLDPITKNVLAALTAAATAVQIATIVSTPLPKFAQGTLSVKGGREGQDSVHALLMPDEAVIPTRTNRKYRTAVKAIYEESVPAEQLHRFVGLSAEQRANLLMQAGGQFNVALQPKEFRNIETRVSLRDINSFTERTVMQSHKVTHEKAGKVDAKELAKALVESGAFDNVELYREMRRQKEMSIRNSDEVANKIAQAISDSNNIRRS